MTRLSKAKNDLEKLYNLGKHDRMIGLTAILTEYFEETKLQPIVVGGLSVELYTRSNYTTYDIDLVASGRAHYHKLLTQQLGFKSEGRGWYHEDLEIAIEIPSNSLEGNVNKVVKVELPNDKYIHVIGVEDIIIHRLESAIVSHKDNPEWSDDYGWAFRMFITHKDSNDIMDQMYLLEEAKKAKVDHIIKEWINV